VGNCFACRKVTFFAKLGDVILAYSVGLITFSLHMLFAWLLRIDRDTAIISSVAFIFSPPFVPPVAVAFNNKNETDNDWCNRLCNW
jgi:hypothetical protein